MKRPPRFPALLAAMLSVAPLNALRAVDPPVTLQLPPSLIASGTTTEIAGQPWGYVVWNVNADNWLATHDVAVHMKPSLGGDFELQGVMSPMSDPNAIKPWIARAEQLGEDLAECSAIAGVLHEQWKNDAAPEPLPAALEDRLSMLGVRASQQPQAAAALRQLGNAHPLYRFVSATAWCGPLGVADGQSVIIELRERDHATGEEGGVVGRVTLTAGVVDALAQPGPPVQVPPDFPLVLPAPNEGPLAVAKASDQIDLGVALRWSIPESLRRQILLTRGFHLWRLAPGYTPPGGMNGASLSAAEVSNPAQVRRLTRNPAAASKVFSAAGSGESGPEVGDFDADRETWFVIDDNDRYATGADPHVVVGSPYTEGQSFEYVVAPVDLLGRIGPVSARGAGVAVHTVPPTVPEVVRVDNIMKNGNQRLRVVWKPNTSPGEIVGTSHYLIYRDRVKNAAPGEYALNRSAHRDDQKNLVFIGAVPHPASPGATLSFDDDALAPQASDYGQTYFYCIRAAHLGPLGYDISSPSPAVFGTIRDRVGPGAPTGYPGSDCPRVGMKFEGVPESLGAAGVPPDRAVFELEANRGTETGQWRDVEWVIFGAINNTQPLNLSNITPFLFYGRGDKVSADLLVGPSASGYRITVAGASASGRVSHIFDLHVPEITMGFRYRIKVRAIGAPTIDMATPGMPNDEYWRPYFTIGGEQPTVSSITPEPSGPLTFRAELPGGPTPASRSLLVQRRVLDGDWANWDSALLPASSSEFFFKSPGGIFLFSAWNAWEIRDPAGAPAPGDCPHDARPIGAANISPIKVVLILPIGSKEYRLYRRIDNGALSLLQQDAGTWDDTVVQAVMHSDGLIPKAGGRIGYYGQVFDENGNPSPLVLLGEKVTAMPDLPIPIMDPAGSAGTVAEPTMLLRAFCPSPGVERIEISMTPPPPITPPNMSSAGRLGSRLFNFKPGTSALQPTDYTVSLMTDPELERDPSVPVTVDAEIHIKSGVKYTVSVRAIGLGGKVGDWSANQEFSWTVPLSGDTVAWPTKPLPQLESWNPLIKAFRYEQDNGTISDHRFVPIPADDYPVAIRIGRIPLGSPMPRSEDPNSNWDTVGVIQDFGRFQLITGFFGIDDAVGFSDDPPDPRLLHSYLAPKLVYSGDIAQVDTSKTLFPLVLYRQQVARLIDGVSFPTPDTDLIQASSMINSISWVHNPEPPATPDLALFIDPFVNVAMFEPNPFDPAAALCLFDNSPVAAGATYQYYLVHFDGRFEPESIINAGTLTFPEAP